MPDDLSYDAIESTVNALGIKFNVDFTEYFIVLAWDAKPEFEGYIFQAIVRAVNACRDTKDYKELGIHRMIREMLQQLIEATSELNTGNLHDIFAENSSLEELFMTLFEASNNTLEPYAEMKAMISLFNDDEQEKSACIKFDNPKPCKAKNENGTEDPPWKEFTPQDIDYTKCLAREWNVGRGGQCGKKPLPNSNVCGMHTDRRTGEAKVSHGFVNGPIPEKKTRRVLEGQICT